MVDLVEPHFNVFEIFVNLYKTFDKPRLLEISLKQSQITFIFEKEIIGLPFLKDLFDYLSSDLTLSIVESPYVTSLNDIAKPSKFALFLKVND